MRRANRENTLRGRHAAAWLTAALATLVAVAASGQSKALAGSKKPAAVASKKPAASKEAEKGAAPPARTASSTSRPTGDPFARLRVKIPKNRLPPLRSVRIRDRRESPTGNIRLTIGSAPSGATVRHGGKVLGKTPLVLTAPFFSTPLDLVISRRGYMLLRTRVYRDRSRGYFFKLNPAKFR